MRSSGIFEAKKNFSALIDEVAAGEEVRITRHGKEVVRMLPVAVRSAAPPPQIERALAQLKLWRAKVKPGPGWQALGDDGRKR